MDKPKSRKRIRRYYGTGNTNNWYDAIQKANANDTDLFPVYDGTDAYVVPISAIKGADNLTQNEVILVGEDGNDYRIKVDVLGKAKVIKDSAYTATLPNESDNTNDKYQALIINQMWVDCHESPPYLKSFQSRLTFISSLCHLQLM